MKPQLPSRSALRDTAATKKILAAAVLIIGGNAFGNPLHTERISMNPSTGDSGNASSLQAVLSRDGCVVAFQSTATNLVDASLGVSQTTAAQIYAVNRCVTPHTLELVSVDSTGHAPANGTCRYPMVSADGRFVAFVSNASNLGGGSTSNSIFIRDRTTQTTSSPLKTWQSTQQIYVDPQKPYMSADALHLALDFQATGISRNLFVFDLSGASVSMQPICPLAAMSASTPCQNAVISAAGTAVVFDTSYGLVTGDTNGFDDDYVYRPTDASYHLVSVNADGSQGDDNINGSGDAVPSSDGSIVAFFNYTARAVGGTGNSLYRKNLATAELTKLNLDSQGQVVGINPPNPSISDDGNRVGFTALSTRPLVEHANPQQTDSLVSEASSERLLSVCRSSVGVYGDNICENIKLSGDGRWAAFDSYATNLDTGTGNSVEQVFVTNVEEMFDLIFFDPFDQ